MNRNESTSNSSNIQISTNGYESFAEILFVNQMISINESDYKDQQLHSSKENENEILAEDFLHFGK